jgi:hypothetical protein
MGNVNSRADNPFRITKSNDLTDEQIDELWVSVTEDDGITGLARPASRTAMYILGGKGSGKSHLMRYYSFPVQVIRYRKSGRHIAEGLTADGYLGIYARCGGMDSKRFSKKGLTDEQWADLFAYYFELWVADKTLAAVSALVDEGIIEPKLDQQLASKIVDLLDKEVGPVQSVEELRRMFAKFRKELDLAVNNAAFVNSVSVEVLLTPGSLFYGIPKIVCSLVSPLKDAVFLYLIDEFENFSTQRQVFVNTLLRDRDGPVAFKVGARLYGRRTLMTAGGERNLQDSEYEDLFLDERFRNSPEQYKQFALRLIARRLEPKPTRRNSSDEEYAHLCDFFEEPDLEWNSPFFAQAKSDAQPRPHLVNFRQKLGRGVADGVVIGPKNESQIDEVVSRVSWPEYPILEKLCILHIFQKWYRTADLIDAAQFVHERAKAKLSGAKHEKFDEFVSKHKADMIAQWFRENGQKQFSYGGLKNFIRMSEGLPRTLITVLKHVHDWATYLDETPFVKGKISKEAQQRGVAEASDLFLDQMLPEGDEAISVGSAIERLCQLFRINRFADKPIETSLMAFSADKFAMSAEAKDVLDLATRTSLIIAVQGGQKERNSKEVTSKFEINAMLAPRRDLPIARRGIVSLPTAELEAVFVEARREEFDLLRKGWERKMTAPAFGRQTAAHKTKDQPDFFE